MHYTNEPEDLELLPESTKTIIAYAEILSEAENTKKKKKKSRYKTKGISQKHFWTMYLDNVSKSILDNVHTMI